MTRRTILPLSLELLTNRDTGPRLPMPHDYIRLLELNRSQIVLAPVWRVSLYHWIQLDIAVISSLQIKCRSMKKIVLERHSKRLGRGIRKGCVRATDERRESFRSETRVRLRRTAAAEKGCVALSESAPRG